MNSREGGKAVPMGTESVAWKKIGEWSGIGGETVDVTHRITSGERKGGGMGIKRDERPFRNVTIY